MKIIHFLIPFFCLIAVFIFFEYTNTDIVIQNYFYNFSTKTWLIDKHAAIPKLLFYDGFKFIYILFVLAIIICLLFFRRYAFIRNNRKGLLIVVFSCLLVPGFIGLLKSTTNVPCPKNLRLYNGNYPYISVMSHYPSNFKPQKKMRCYPAGHASSGFALMSLFFLFSNRRKNRIAITLAIFTGWSIGLYKMLIGDHFFSHTLITMILSWLIIFIIDFLVQRIYKETN